MTRKLLGTHTLRTYDDGSVEVDAVPASTATVTGTAVATTTAPAAPAAPVSTTTRERAPRGVSPGAGILSLEGEALTSTCTAMKAAGATWLRVDLDWPSIEAVEGTFTWGAVDAVVAEANAAGLKVLALPSYWPAWAVGAGITSTAIDAFGAFLDIAVERYADQGVRTWEIWNEPNLAGNWNGATNAAAYGQLVAYAYRSITAVDPAAFILSGGLSPATDAGGNLSPATFLTELYAAVGGTNWDAVGMHPYSYPYAPMLAASWNTFYDLPSIQAIMAANGDGSKQIWMTELGWPTTFPSTPTNAVTPAVQAQMLTAAFAQLGEWSWAGPAFWYNWADGQDPNGDFGLVTATGAAKPALAAFEAA